MSYMFKPHKLADESKIRFYQTPKVLFTSDKYKDLGMAEKQFYAILRDRQELSRKNKWIDKNGDIYLIFTVEKLAELCNISTRTVVRYKKALIKHNLLREFRTGQGKPNRLYVGVADYDVTGQEYNSRSDKSTIQEVTKVLPNDTDNSETDFIDTDIYSASKESTTDINNFFEDMWKLYPNKKNKGQVSKSKKKEIYKLGDEFERCIERYIKDVEEQRVNGFTTLRYKNGSTFFNSGYVDYLDENYQDTLDSNKANEGGSNGYKGGITEDKTESGDEINFAELAGIKEF